MKNHLIICSGIRSSGPVLRNVKDKHEKLCHVWSLVSDESASECDAGQPRRHLLTTGWSAFVNKKKLVSGDAVLFLR
jgi:hypothetical protein